MNRSATTLLLAASLLLCACAPPPAPTAAPPKPAYLTIAVHGDGTVTIDGEVVQQSEFDRRFAALAATGADVIIAPDKDVDYGKVARVMAAAQRTGLTKKMGVIGGT